MTQNATNPAWERDAVFVRLTKRRKAKLLAIAEDMGAGSTPSDAIERAIDLASAGGKSSNEVLLEKLACLQDVVDQIFLERRADAKLCESGISIAMRNSQTVLDLLSAAATKSDDEDWDGR